MNYSLIVLIVLSIMGVYGDYEYGICKLKPTSDYLTNTFIGDVRIYKSVGDVKLKFEFNIRGIGLNDSSYGVKIMRYGYPANDLGEVYNPNNINTTNGNCPSESESESESESISTSASSSSSSNVNYRVGDLNDFILTNGQFSESVYYTLPQLSGDNSIIGRAIAFYNLPLCHSSNDIHSATQSTPPSILSTCIIGIGNGNLSSTINQIHNGTNIAHASTTEQANGQVILEPTTNINTTVSGFAVFSTSNNSQHRPIINRGNNSINSGVEIIGVFMNLDSSTPHGIHIHSFGDISRNDGSSIGEHWSNSSQVHSLPTQDTNNRHFGDLGNVCAFDSNFHLAYYYFNTNYFGSINNVFGRSLAIHKSQDFGNQNMGGPRILQGVIALVNPFNQQYSNNIIPDNSKFHYDNICRNGTYNGFNF